MHPERFVESVAAAVERVRNDSFYAFIGENRLLRYFVRQSPCDLMTLPNPPLQTISYAFAFTPNHPLIDQINTKLLEMRESGYLHSLEEV